MEKFKEKPPLSEDTNGINNNNNNGAVKPKEKRRSNEKRKEKSRDAARCRRSRETEIFTELAQVLPLRREDVEQLDKASIMRLSIAFLKVREMLKLFPKVKDLPVENKPTEKSEEDDQKPFDLWNSSVNIKLLSQAMDGFLMILSGDGDVIYVSENITDFLGISQIDVLGQQIWEYSHQCDHEELKEALNVRKMETKQENSKKDAFLTAHRDFFIRLKCTLTSRGRSVNIKSASYKVIHVTGHMVVNADGDRILIAVGRPLPHPSNIEIPLGSTTFLTKHSLDMKFTYVDDKMLSLLGYRPEDLLGKSLYDCHHGGDSESLMTTFKSVLSKGQGETCRYRFLGKCGGYCWLVTQATIVYDKQKPQSVVCVNYVISDLENNNEIYSCAQLDAYRKENEITQQSIEDQQEQERENENIEEEPPLLQAINTNSNSPKPSDVIIPTLRREINKNNNINNTRYRESSLSPIRRTLNNCSISARLPEKRPKSVTASVFTQVRVPDRNILLNSILNNSPLPPTSQLAAATPGSGGSRAQSVTASVFTPISALPNFNANRLSFNNNTSNKKGFGGENKSDKTFTPQQNRTKDMNKGFLSFSDENTDLTMLKEEPDDLTHLAPTAGDACIPLDESTPLFGEMLEGLILPDSYGTLLHDDINSLDSQQSNCNNSKNQIDPFINYRDESSDTNSSPHLLSPGGASKSPEVSSIPSLCSPNSLSQEDEFAFMTMNVEDDIDLTMRAPYIPMNEQEDLPLLTDDLMWSTFSEELKEIKEALQMEAIKNGNNINNGGLNVGVNGSTTTSSNDGSNESSLAALLCGNSSIQQQDQTISDQIENNKKRKFDQPGTNIVESIETFGQSFSKNSTNDCWAMNDLLQLNSAQNSSTLNHQENVRPEKQNIIVNRAILSTVHMPFLTTAAHNNSQKSNLCRLNQTSMLSMNNSSNKCNNSDEVTNRKFVTKILSTTPPPSTTLKTTNNLSNAGGGGCGGGGGGDLNNNPMICNNKRHLNVAASLDTKRVKNSSSVEIQTSPQLLQQLMAPTPQRQKTKSPFEKGQNTRWGPDGGGQQSPGSTSSVGSPSSNSVLKNLLVSGCDDPFPSRPPDVAMSDDSSRDSMQSLQMSPGPYYSQPLYCKTSTAQVLRNFCTGSNPMIGGVGILPSPPIPTAMDDSVPPGLISMDSDSGSDSGIECNVRSTFSTKSISKAVTDIPNSKITSDPGGQIETLGKAEPKTLIDGNLMQSGTEDPPPLERDKMSPSFMETDNPLCSPFLFDLCNDDYGMGEPIGADFLQDTEITKVLNEWTAEMT